MAESSRVGLSFRKESEWGEEADGQYKYTNFSEESFSLNKTKERSSRILKTREYSGLISKSQDVEGGYNFSLQSGNADEIFESSLMSVWSDIVGGSGGGSITAGASGSNLEITFTIETGTGIGGIITFGSSISAPSILKDQVIFVSETPSAVNDGAFIVKEVIDTHNFKVNSALVTATYESLTVIAGDVIRNGNTISSFTFEREHSDISKFFQYLGSTISTTEITIEPENEIMVNFSFIGKDETTSDTTVSTGTPVDASDKPEFVVGDNIDGVYFDYELVANCLVSDFNFTIDNQTEGRKAIAVFGSCAPRIKPIDVNGSITLWFEDFTEYNKYINDTPFQLTVIASDSLGNKYAFTLEQVEYSSGTVNVGSAEDEVPEEHEFMSSTNGIYTVQICKVTV